MEMALQMKAGLETYKKGFAKRVSAYAAIFVVGAVVGATLFGRDGEGSRHADWAGQMASFHAIGATISVATAKTNAVFDDLSLHYDLPDLSFQSRAQMEVDGKIVLSTAFLAKNGSPVVLYRVQTSDADLSEPVVGLRKGLQSATWTEGGIKYLLIGGRDAQLIWNAARAVPKN